ncbi:MAG: sensor histidine kinase [Pseudomonadota bacterium]
MLRRFLPAGLPGLAVLLLVTVFAAAAPAAVLSVEPGVPEYPVGLSMDVLEDKTAALDIAAVSSTLYESRFRPVARAQTNYGFTRSALWFRVQIDFSAGAGHAWHLVEGHPILDELTFFLPDRSGGWKQVVMGDVLPFDARPYKLREFVLPVPPELVDARQPVTLYMRVAGQGALNVGLRLLDQQALAERVSRQQWGFGLFYGALSILFLYNLFLFLSTRERSQLYYIVWLGGFIMLFASLNGLGLQYVWPHMPALNGWFPVFTCIALWGGLQFTRIFLDIKRDNPRTDAAFRWMITAIIVVFLLALLLPKHWMYILGNAMPVLFAVVMFAAGVVRLRQGYQPARLFVAGWGVLLIGAILLPLSMLGLLPVSTFTTYSPQFGAVLQGMLLSLALGERMKLLKVENERIQQESHEKLEQMFAQLRSLDADKLRFLHYLSHELNTPLNWMTATRAIESSAVSDDVRNMVDAVEAGQQRMIDLVGTVLRYFDLADEDPASQSLAPLAPMWLVDDLLREFSPAIEAKKLQVRNRVPADLVVLANEQRLRRVLALLLDNAINFSSEGQTVEFGGGTETYGTRGVVTIRDQGRGIDGEHLPRLFEPFFMVGSHHREGGFGLSLATARLMISHMGGDMRVRSAGRGQGAEFSVILPARAAAAADPADADPAQTPAG